MKKFKLGEFERNSAIVFAISMLANVVTYLYQIVMGNLLSPADYGTINTLLSLSIVVGVPSGIISTLVATYTAKYQAVGKPELIGGFMHKMLRASVLLACVVFAAVSSPMFCRSRRPATYWPPWSWWRSAVWRRFSAVRCKVLSDSYLTA